MTLNSGMMPQYLYKFRSLVGEQRDFTRDIIQNSRLFWPSPSQFNDPFDCAPSTTFNGSFLKREAYIRRLIRTGLPDATKKDRKNIVRKAMARSPEDIVSSMNNMRNELRDSVGVCSLTEENSHILMWAHYADSHKGICLRFNTKTIEPHFTLAFPVTYSEIRPSVDILDHQKDDLLERVLLTKANFWEYEREWRLLDQDCAGLHPFPAQALDGVIFGSEISEENRNIVLGWIESTRRNIALFQARLDDKLFFLHLDPLQS